MSGMARVCGRCFPFWVRGRRSKAGLRGLFRQLWHDDRGAVLATEWALLTTIFLIGLVPALIVIRQGLLSKMLDISSATQLLDESYGYTGTAVGEDPDRASGSHSPDRASGTARADTLGIDRSDPVLEEAAKVSRRELVRDNQRFEERHPRSHRPRGYAFTAGSLFVEDRHLDGKMGRVSPIPAHAVPAD